MKFLRPRRLLMQRFRFVSSFSSLPPPSVSSPISVRRIRLQQHAKRRQTSIQTEREQTRTNKIRQERISSKTYFSLLCVFSSSTFRLLHFSPLSLFSVFFLPFSSPRSFVRFFVLGPAGVLLLLAQYPVGDVLRAQRRR